MSREVEHVHTAIASMGVAGFLGALGLKHRRLGRVVRFPCAVHGGKDANAVAEIKDGRVVFACHSLCAGAGGDALTLVAAVMGLDQRNDFRRVLEAAGALAGVSISGTFTPRVVEVDPEVEELRRRAVESAERILDTLIELCPLDSEGLRYMLGRGLSEATCRAARVGYVSDPSRTLRVLLGSFSADTLDEVGVVYPGERFAFASHPLLFPLIVKGRPAYMQGRSLDPKVDKRDRWRSMRGGVPALYNVDAITGNDRPIVLAEGPIDTLSAIELYGDTHAAVGIFGAGHFKREWAIALRGRRVVVATDPDEAGNKGAAAIAEVLHGVGAEVRRARIDRDLNEILCAEKAA